MSLDLFRYFEPSLCSTRREEGSKAKWIAVSRQETQLRVLGTLSASLYTGDVLTQTHKLSPITESPRPRLVTSYRATEHLRHHLRHTALFYVTNLEYRVIANHLSASGLRLAPHLTHAPSCQPDGRGAGDTFCSLWVSAYTFPGIVVGASFFNSIAWSQIWGPGNL